MESVELRGIWWPQEMDDSTPDEAVAGTLSFSPTEGGELNLIGHFVPFFERIDEDPADSGDLDTIYGLTTEGEYITLLDCIPSGSSSNRVFTTESYQFTQIISGGLVETNTTYWKCSFSFHNLKWWTQIDSVTTPGDSPLSQGPAISKSLSTSEADILLNIHEDMASVIGNNVGNVYFAIYPCEPLTINEYFSQYIRPLQNLVTLGVGTAVSPTFINIYSDPFGHPHSKSSYSYEAANYHVPDDIRCFEMNFTLKDINFKEDIENWITSYETLGRLHDHYFGTLYANNMYVRLQFMSMIFALEDYHRRAFPGKQKIMDEQIFKRFRDLTLERMPRVSAYERVKNIFQSLGNEPSAKDRLEDITNRHEDMFPESYDIESNLKTVTDTRHKIAHSLGETLSSIKVKEHEILLRIIALAVVLDIAGVNAQKAREILEEEYNKIGYIKKSN